MPTDNPRILSDPDGVMARLGSIEGTQKVILDQLVQIRQSSHEIRDKIGEHHTRLAVAESHITECKNERLVAVEIHKAFTLSQARIEKGEDRDTLLDQRLLKLEAAVEKITAGLTGHDQRLLKAEDNLAGIKGTWSGYISKAWHILQAVAIAYIGYKLGIKP